MRAIIHHPARLISLQEFSHKPGGQDMSDTPEIADQLATTTPAPGSMSGALDTGAMMIKATGEQAWPEGDVDLLGHLFLQSEWPSRDPGPLMIQGSAVS
jgi:hypothetical protein